MIVKSLLNFRKRAKPSGLALFLFPILVSSLSGCSLFHDRPIQLMSDTSSAIKAAREVGADSLAAEKFRLAGEAFFRAQNEYRLKNFAVAEKYAKRAKRLAEESEFDALRQGSARTSLLPPEVTAPPPDPSTYEAPAGQLATEAIRKEGQGGSGASSGTPPSQGFSP
jgi:hypothetical protein